MKKWIKHLMMILVGSCIWLLFDYFYYGTLEPIGMTLLFAFLFGVGMWGVELFFHRKNKKE